MRKSHQSELPLSLSRLERRFAVWRAKRRPGQLIPKALQIPAPNAAAPYDRHPVATNPRSSIW